MRWAGCRTACAGSLRWRCRMYTEWRYVVVLGRWRSTAVLPEKGIRQCRAMGTEETAKHADGWTPVARRGGQRRARWPVLRGSVGTFPRESVRQSCTVEAKPSKGRGVGVLGGRNRRPRSCLARGAWVQPVNQRPHGRSPAVAVWAVWPDQVTSRCVKEVRADVELLRR